MKLNKFTKVAFIEELIRFYLFFVPLLLKKEKRQQLNNQTIKQLKKNLNWNTRHILLSAISDTITLCHLTDKNKLLSRFSSWWFTVFQLRSKCPIFHTVSFFSAAAEPKLNVSAVKKLFKVRGILQVGGICFFGQSLLLLLLLLFYPCWDRQTDLLDVRFKTWLEPHGDAVRANVNVFRWSSLVCHSRLWRKDLMLV